MELIYKVLIKWIDGIVSFQVVLADMEKAAKTV